VVRYNTTREAAEFLEMSERQVRRYNERGQLGQRIGRTPVITDKDLATFERSPKGRPPKKLPDS
jgi:hypothetical protein